MKPLPGSVLVGVTGPGENTAALEFAIEEASRLGCGITLVHAVVPPPPPPPGGLMISYESTAWADVGRAIVAEVADELAGLDGSVEVATVVGHGSPGAVLSELSRDVSRVVLAHQDVNRLVRLVTGSTTARVAAHAHCPVISVPAAGHPGKGSGVLAVGVHNDGGPPEVVAAALAEAKVHGWSTRLVHAWRLPAAYDDLLVGDGSWETASRQALEEVAATHTGSDVTAEVIHDWPADALLEQSRQCAMVVVGRHGRIGAISPRLGSRTRALLASAECPVMVVPLTEES